MHLLISCFTLLIFIIWFHSLRLKKILSCIIDRIRGYVYKVRGINFTILLHLYGHDAKSKMLIIFYFIKFYNVNVQQLNVFRNCFVIINYCHLTKVSSQINKCIIFEPNELSITLSTLWCDQYVRCMGAFGGHVLIYFHRLSHYSRFDKIHVFKWEQQSNL